MLYFENTDDDSIGIKTVLISAASGTTESGGSVSFACKLSSAAFQKQLSLKITGLPYYSVTIPVSVNDTSEAVVSVNSITYTTANWAVNQTVTVTGLEKIYFWN